MEGRNKRIENEGLYVDRGERAKENEKKEKGEGMREGC